MKTISWPIIGQSKAKVFFEHLLTYEQKQPGSLGGTYILSGPEGSGKTTILESFFEKLGVISKTHVSRYEVVHLDLLEGKKEIGVSQVRTFNSEIALSSFGNGYRLGVITGAERLNSEAGNALLKTLEEAHEGVMIFIITRSVDHLPKTITSRAQIINFTLVATDSIYEWLVEKHTVSRPQARQLAALVQGQPGRALRLAHERGEIETELAPIRYFYELFSLPLGQRFKIVEKLLGNLKGQALVEQTSFLIQQWRLGLRDIRLLHLQQPDMLIYNALETELRLCAKRLSIRETRRLDNLLQIAMKYLSANVNPKLVVEQIVLNVV